MAALPSGKWALYVEFRFHAISGKMQEDSAVA
jgi:hypothetical protein